MMDDEVEKVEVVANGCIHKLPHCLECTYPATTHTV